MAFDDYLADRVRQTLQEKNIVFNEKRMFGGLCIMVDDKMLLGIDIDKKTGENRLMLRLDPETHEQVLQKQGAREMDFTGKPMKGFVYISSEAFDDDESLSKWVQLALEYNPKAKRSK